MEIYLRGITSARFGKYDIFQVILYNSHPSLEYCSNLLSCVVVPVIFLYYNQFYIQCINLYRYFYFNKN